MAGAFTDGTGVDLHYRGTTDGGVPANGVFVQGDWVATPTGFLFCLTGGPAALATWCDLSEIPSTGIISDVAYDATTWNGVTGVAPSKNSVRDKIEALSAATVALLAAPSGVSATDSAALQAAHDALPATGGRIVAQVGQYDITAGVTFTKPVCLQGAGAGTLAAGGGGTRFVCSSATAVPITVSVAGCSFMDFALVNTNGGNPSAGSGILFTNSDAMHMTRVTVIGFWNDVQTDQGSYWTMTDCHFLDAVNWSVYIRNTANFDFGDPIIKGCTFCSVTTTRISKAAVRWESGGGLRFIGNKTNGNETNLAQSFTDAGLDIAVNDGGSTSILIAEGNGFEGIASTAYGILVRQNGTGTGTFSKIVIVGNEFLGGGGVQIGGTVAAKLGYAMIADNVFTGNSIAVYLKNCYGINVGVNHCSGLTGNKAVWIDTGCTDCTVAPQVIVGDGKAYVFDSSIVSTTHGPWGSKPRVVQREIPSTTSSVTYTTLNVVQFGQYSSAMLTVVLSGQISGVGAFLVQAVRSIRQDAAGGVVTIATVGADVVVGTSPTLLFDITSNQTVRVKVRLPGSGTDVFGTCTVIVDGIYTHLWKGIDS